MVILWFLLTPVPEVTTWRIGEETISVAEFESHLVTQPRRVLVSGETIIIMDRDHRLWFLNRDGLVRRVMGGRGQGPGETTIRPRLFLEGDDLLALIPKGTVRQRYRYNLDGSLIEAEQVGPYIYATEMEHISVTGMSREPTAPARVTRASSGRVQTIVLGAEDDRTLWSRIGVRHHRGHTLVYTAHSIKRQIYFVHFHAASGDVLARGSIRLRDPREGAEVPFLRDPRPGFSVPVIEGVTESWSVGFVFTEHTVPGGFRILRIYDPVTRSWEARRVVFGKQEDLTFFQHLGGTLWMAYRDSGAWIFFDMMRAD